MGKHTDATTLAMSAFASVGWTGEKIATMPSNFTGSVKGNEYIRVHLLMTNSLMTFNKSEPMAGQMVIDIFTPSGAGPKRAAQIADTLDKYLVGKTFQSSTGMNNMQFGASILNDGATDKANQMLFRNIYTVPVSYF